MVENYYIICRNNISGEEYLANNDIQRWTTDLSKVFVYDSLDKVWIDEGSGEYIREIKCSYKIGKKISR